MTVLGVLNGITKFCISFDIGLNIMLNSPFF